MTAPLELRPYQMLCLFCAQHRPLEGPLASAIAEVAALIRDYPDRPVRLTAAARDVYAYQDPLSPDAAGEFQRKRDLDILAALDLPPGIVLPARTLLYRLLKAIPTVRGLCGYDNTAAPTWAGCPRAFSGDYETAIADGLTTLIPVRDPDELRADKANSVAAMHQIGALRIRPHVIMCAVCNYGTNHGHPEPLAVDNIVEFIEIIRARPDVSIILAPGADWMICAPCPKRVASLNACVNVAGSGGLSNEKRDLDLLQLLDLQYEDTLPARELLALLFTRVPDTTAICRRDHPSLSVWWDGCGEANRAAGNAGYAHGRALLIEELATPQERGLGPTAPAGL